MTIGLLVFFIVILIFGLIVFGIIVSRTKGRQLLNVEKFRSDWLTIEHELRRDNEASYVRSILEADKLLDHALKQRGFKGQSMGDRMRSASSSWSNNRHVWTAHKLRNKIAHEPAYKVRYDITRRALSAFKQALKDLGAI